MDDEDRRWIEEYDGHRHNLESLSKKSLVRITQAMGARIDELNGTKRSPEGEEIIGDDPVVEDEEEYIK